MVMESFTSRIPALALFALIAGSAACTKDGLNEGIIGEPEPPIEGGGPPEEEDE